MTDQEKAMIDPLLLIQKEASQAALEQSILAGDIRFIVSNRN